MSGTCIEIGGSEGATGSTGLSAGSFNYESSGAKVAARITKVEISNEPQDIAGYYNLNLPIYEPSTTTLTRSTKHVAYVFLDDLYNNIENPTSVYSGITISKATISAGANFRYISLGNIKYIVSLA